MVLSFFVRVGFGWALDAYFWYQRIFHPIAYFRYKHTETPRSIFAAYEKYGESWRNMV